MEPLYFWCSPRPQMAASRHRPKCLFAMASKTYSQEQLPPKTSDLEGS